MACLERGERERSQTGGAAEEVDALQQVGEHFHEPLENDDRHHATQSAAVERDDPVLAVLGHRHVRSVVAHCGRDHTRKTNIRAMASERRFNRLVAAAESAYAVSCPSRRRRARRCLAESCEATPCPFLSEHAHAIPEAMALPSQLPCGSCIGPESRDVPGVVLILVRAVWILVGVPLGARIATVERNVLVWPSGVSRCFLPGGVPTVSQPSASWRTAPQPIPMRGGFPSCPLSEDTHLLILPTHTRETLTNQRPGLGRERRRSGHGDGHLSSESTMNLNLPMSLSL